MQKELLEQLANMLNAVQEGPINTGAEWYKVRKMFICIIIFEYTGWATLSDALIFPENSYKSFVTSKEI